MDRIESAPTSTELQQLLELGRTTNNEALRRLVSAYQELRRVGADAVADIESEYGPDAIERSVPLQLVKQFTSNADA